MTELAPGVAIASRGESTPTPWHTPRELDDAVLGERVRDLVAGMPSGGTTIWNLHMPPFGTGIDRAPELDEGLRVRYDGSGEPRMRPVGSATIRDLIESDGPTVALHGHIHEGRGRYRLGRTTGVNPGSTPSKTPSGGGLARVTQITKAASDSRTGTLTSAIAGRNSTISDMDDSIAAWDIRLELRRTSLQQTYTALETALSNMQSQGNWLAGQIAQLPKSS